MKTIFLTTPGLQTWTVPSDWSDTNFIECLAAGGSGAAAADAGSGCGGGGGGAYSAISNLVGLSPGQAINYQVGAGSPSLTCRFGVPVSNKLYGQPQFFDIVPTATYGHTFFNGLTLASSSVGAEQGWGGQAGVFSGGSGGPGGKAANGIGSIKFSGGNGGSIIGNTFGTPQSGCGGGGAAGPHGNGINGHDFSSGQHQGSNGGGPDGGFGGSGGLGYGETGVNTGSNISTPGTAVTEWVATGGATAGVGGGGGGAGYNADLAIVAGDGALYGGGGGGAANFNHPTDIATSGAGQPGIIIITYGAPTPPPFVPPPGGYIIERFDNRLWPTVENCWCVDCGFTLDRPTPNADLIMLTATGAGKISGVTNLVGGSGYSAATTAQVVDANGLGPGTGALLSLTIVAGVITLITVTAQGADYLYPAVVINDPTNTGSGASAKPILDTSSTFFSSVPIFQSSDVGSVIRAGYGVAVITQFLNSQTVIVDIISPIAKVELDGSFPPDDVKPQTQVAGTWTMTKPISNLYLPQLVGFTVTGIADGQIIPPTLVPANGIITLATPASAIIVGLAFEAQLQSVYLDAGEPTVQGQRKKIAEVTVRVENSAAFQIGANQPDGSVQSPPLLAPPWENMVDAPTHAVAPFNSPALPLFTGDIRVPVPSGYNTRGQVAVQQTNPLPLQVLDFVPEVLSGDKPSQEAPKRQRKNGQEEQ